MTDKEVFEYVMEWAFKKGGEFREMHNLYYEKANTVQKQRIARFLLQIKLIYEKRFILNLSPGLLEKIGLDGTGDNKHKNIKNLIDTLNRDRKRVSYLGEIP